MIAKERAQKLRLKRRIEQLTKSIAGRRALLRSLRSQHANFDQSATLPQCVGLQKLRIRKFINGKPRITTEEKRCDREAIKDNRCGIHNRDFTREP